MDLGYFIKWASQQEGTKDIKLDAFRHLRNFFAHSVRSMSKKTNNKVKNGMFEEILPTELMVPEDIKEILEFVSKSNEEQSFVPPWNISLKTPVLGLVV
jgi:hypothetical protein